MSEEYTSDAYTSRMTSAPRRLTASCASSVLPSDLDILRPLSSSVRPWLMTLRNGACPRVATAHTSDELNHPRACSTASRYASAGQRRSGRCPSTASCELPESNHTSRMSSVFANASPPHLEHRVLGALKSLAGRMYHASVPSRAKISSVRCIEARSSVTVAQVSHLSAGIGTPHARWREMHQSGRVSVMLRMRSRDHGGNQLAPSISATIFSRNPSWSMLRNHCSVARKISGLWHRQQCG